MSLDKGMKGHLEAAEQRFRSLIHGRYFSDVCRWAISGQFPGDVHPSLAENVDTALGLFRGEHQTRPVEVTISPTDLPHPGNGTAAGFINGRWATPRQEETVGGMGTISRGTRIDIPIDSRRIERYWRDARIHAHLNSKASMALVWPVGLWVIAVGITFYKLVRTVL